jgi:hypothetical protein
MAGMEIEVDPGELRLPPSRRDGADPAKFARQVNKHGNSTAGMPLIWVTQDGHGILRINDGVTRATRVHKIVNGGQSAPPGEKVTVEVIDQRPSADFSANPKISER